MRKTLSNCINIYADGGCRGNGKEEAIGGFGVVLGFGEITKEFKSAAKNTTNNIMEISAVLKGVSEIKDKRYPVNVYSDSSYVINCLKEKWYLKWEKNGWKTTGKKPVKNKKLWEELIAEIKTFPKINFFQVKGHIESEKELKDGLARFNKNNETKISMEDFIPIAKMNNIADALANDAMDELV
jgi:ribonuclease HI